MAEPAALPAISVEEVREYFCCPYIWWFRNLDLPLEDREQLKRLMHDPEFARQRYMPLEVSRMGCIGFLSVSGAVAGMVTIIASRLVVGPVEDLMAILMAVGWLTMIPSLIGIRFWLRWRRRTPRFDGPLPGRVLLQHDPLQERRVLISAQHGITGSPGYMLEYGRELMVAEIHTVEAPKTLADSDQAQLIAHALLAEDEFRKRPVRGFLVYPDRTFEVRITEERVGHLLDALKVMREARAANSIPEARPSWHLCPACPLVDCPKRVAGSEPPAEEPPMPV
jgi:CRISPR/Cas system-associated exonuclease Cas4 (RecB family)